MSISIAEASRSRMRIAAGLVSEAAGGVAAVTHLVRSGGGGVRAAAEPGVLWRGTKPGPPVMLVHGLGADSSCFEAMATALHRTGHTVYSVNYSCVGVDIATCGRQLAVEAARLRADTGAHRIHIVAHSLGGVVLRWAVANTRMGEWVGLAFTLGSPHQGSPLARLAPQGLPGFGMMISQLRPGLPDHACGQDRPARSVRWVAVAAQLDWVVPPRYALLPASDNVRNVILPGGGHLSLPADGRCLEIVRGELAASDGDGVSHRVGDGDLVGAGDRVGARDPIGAGDRAGARDPIGAGDRAGVRDPIGAGDRAGVRDPIGAGDRAGSGDRAGDGGSRLDHVDLVGAGDGTVVDLRTRPRSRTHLAGAPVAVTP